MTEIVALKHSEIVRLDLDCLDAFYRRQGVRSADLILDQAIEELAERLQICLAAHKANALSDLCTHARALGALAEQIGMTILARVSGDVLRATASGDPIAIDAVVARLLRTGDQSLMVMWDSQHLSM